MLPCQLCKICVDIGPLIVVLIQISIYFHTRPNVFFTALCDKRFCNFEQYESNSFNIIICMYLLTAGTLCYLAIYTRTVNKTIENILRLWVETIFVLFVSFFLLK